MLAFLTRRKDTPMTDTTATTEPTTEQDHSNVVMRFLTQGGATVELHRQDRTVRYLPGQPGYLMPNGETRLSHGFNWRCLGCDATGGDGRYGLGDRHFDETYPHNSRDEANQHADTCRAMPKPTA